MLGLGVIAAADDHKPTTITFKAPGAGTGAGQGTYVNAISSTGEVAGWYIDGNEVYHGFIRRVDGEIIKVNAFRAGTAAYQGTLIEGMNAAGATTGYYVDLNNVNHGFLRDPHGRLMTIDVPAAGRAAYQGTIACNVNLAGTVLGIFSDPENNWHYFLRSLGGKYTVFDPPDSDVGLSALGWGYPDELNDAGAAASMFLDANDVLHGWLRTPDGEITRIDVPAAGTASGEGTYTVSITSAGAIVGGYIEPGGSWAYAQGFLSGVHGGITTFGPPLGKTSVESNDMNASSEIVGTCWSPNGEDFAFSRSPNGTYTVFSLPGAGTGNYQGTYGIAVNPQGWIAGYVINADFAAWSFVMIP
jgi:hypothetical protein